MELYELDSENFKDFIDYVIDDKLVVKRKSKDFFLLSDGDKYSIDKKLGEIYDVIGSINSGRIIRLGDKSQNKTSEVKSKSSGETKQERSSLIFGKDNTDKIIGIETVGQNLVLIKEDGTTENRPMKYWSLTKRKFSNSTKLDGNQSFCHFNEFTSLEALKDFNKIARYRNYYSQMNPIIGEMIRTGITMYSGMKLQDLSVLSTDIEAPGIVRDKHSKVFCIGNVFRGKDGVVITKTFRVDNYSDDKEMILDWCKWVVELDPNIIIGHNVHSYDLDYMEHCVGSLPLGKYGQELDWGRERNFRVSGDEKWKIREAKIFGRQVIDTMMLSVNHDIGRNYPTWGLKPIIEYETHSATITNPKKRSDWQKKLIKRQKTRVFYEAGDIGKKWKDLGEREKIVKYCIDDCYDSLDLFDLQIVPFFYYTQYVPMTMQEVVASGTGAQIDAFLVRSYLQEGKSIPETSKYIKYGGGISMGVPGIYKHVYKVDVASLYPSIIITNKLYSKKKDPDANFLKMVTYFTEKRLEYKKTANETGDLFYRGLEQAFKIIINSAYGVNGTQFLCFNDFAIADEITRTGREILEKGVKWASGDDFKHIQKITKTGILETHKDGRPKMEWVLEKTEEKSNGFSIVNVDTDSFSFSSGKKITDEEFKSLIVDLNSLYDSGIIWEDDGYFTKFIVMKAKNYVLEMGKGKVKVKGSGLTDTKKEKKLKQFSNEIIELMLNGRIDHFFDLYRRYAMAIVTDFKVDEWAKRTKVSDSVLKPARKQEQDVYDTIFNRYPDAKLGEKFLLYRKDDDTLGFADFFDNDYSVGSYLGKLYSSLGVFENILPMDMIPNYKNTTNRHLIVDTVEEK